MCRIVLVLLIALAVSSRGAEFAPVFTANAVLQRDMPVAIWGTGREGENVTVSLLDKSASATVVNGRWAVQLPALPATESATLRLVGDTTVELPNVAIGEVWLLTGQSNMEWRLNQCSPHSDALLASADNSKIRQIKIPLRAYAGDPLPKFDWRVFDKASAPFFSAVGYYFAESLQSKLGVVIGLVNCSFGGTPIQAWMSREAILAAGGDNLLADHDKKAAAFPDAAAYDAAWKAFDTARREWEERSKAGTPESELGPKPVEPYGFRTKGRPSGLRESMFAVITPYTARGVLWYQGESNAGQKEDYGAMLENLIREMRKDWTAPTLPFYVAQISSPSSNSPDDQDAYAVIREAQRRVAGKEPNTGFVVTLDYGEKGNVHPIQKQPVGERFARLAATRVYGIQGMVAQSPSASRASLQDGNVVVEFLDLPGRLKLGENAPPTLETAAADGTWLPATARLSEDGRRLVVTPATGSAKPIKIRYAWRNFCTLSLYSDEGLPVSPWSLSIDPAKMRATLPGRILRGHRFETGHRASRTQKRPFSSPCPRGFCGRTDQHQQRV